MKVMKLLFAITLLVVVVLPQAIGTSVGSVVWAASTAPAALLPNDMTQARLRVSQCVYKEPEMEVH